MAVITQSKVESLVEVRLKLRSEAYNADQLNIEARQKRVKTKRIPRENVFSSKRFQKAKV